MSRLLEEYGKAAGGKPADLDGDGVAEVRTVTLPGGGRRVISRAPDAGFPGYVLEEQPNGDTVEVYDNDGDGRPDAIIEDRYSEGTHVDTQDTERRGVFDFRRTEVQRPDAGMVDVVEERLGQDGGFEITQRFSYPENHTDYVRPAPTDGGSQ